MSAKAEVVETCRDLHTKHGVSKEIAEKTLDDIFSALDWELVDDPWDYAKEQREIRRLLWE